MTDRAYNTTLQATQITRSLTEVGTVPMTSLEREWIVLRSKPFTWLHGQWIDVERLERLLGDDLRRTHVNARDSRGKSQDDEARLVLAESGPVVAVVDDNGRFERLLNRQALVESVSRNVASQ